MPKTVDWKKRHGDSQKRVRELERMLWDLADHHTGHRCPYEGTDECPWTKARELMKGA